MSDAAVQILADRLRGMPGLTAPPASQNQHLDGGASSKKVSSKIFNVEKFHRRNNSSSKIFIFKIIQREKFSVRNLKLGFLFRAEPDE